MLSGRTNPNEKEYNFFSFSLREKITSSELDSLTPPSSHEHPEYGLLPYDAPCENCLELTDHRDATSRYFTEKGTKGKKFYDQHSYGAINYKDASGWWREINYRLHPRRENIFEASDQPSPVVINLAEKFT